MNRHRMVVVLLDQAMPMDVAIPMQVFAQEASDFYEVTAVSVDGGAVSVAGGGMRMVPDAAIDSVATAQTVLVPGYRDAATRPVDPRVTAALRAAAAQGARIASICTGAFALAQAGLLEGFTVTTHWESADTLARQHPGVTVDAAALFIDNGSILTSGGVAAGVDLALHILRSDRGDSIANHVARRIVMAPRPENSQGQFRELSSGPVEDAAIAASQRWILTALDRPLTVSIMAEQAHLSARQFHRRFVKITGDTPLTWLRAQRIERARTLLETTDLPVDAVAKRSGLGTAANLRALFRRATGVAPSSYRQAFSRSAALGVA